MCDLLLPFSGGNVGLKCGSDFNADVNISLNSFSNFFSNYVMFFVSTHFVGAVDLDLMNAVH